MCYSLMETLLLEMKSGNFEINLFSRCCYLASNVDSSNHFQFEMQAASMFKGPVPPLVPFSLGSLGFMTPFCILKLLSF